MHSEGKLKLSLHNTNYCLIEVVSKVDLIVFFYIYVFSRTCILCSINDNYQYNIWFTRTHRVSRGIHADGIFMAQ